ncbi:unnamed protein product [Ixodes pacificus]
MQIGTGASVSVVPEALCAKHWANIPKEPCNLKLRTYGGNFLTVTVKLSVPVEHNGQRKTLPLIAVKAPGGNVIPLLGRDWLEELRLDWSCTNSVREEKEAMLLEMYAELFGESAGLIKGQHSKLVLKEQSTHVYCKP